MTGMVESVAAAIRDVNAKTEGLTFTELSQVMARVAIEAIPDDDEAFLAALSERVHEARFNKSGETYPVLRNFIRALKDAALQEGKEGE